MVRYDILDKGSSFTNSETNRVEISLLFVDEKKNIYKHQSNKLSGKFSLTIEKSN